jgi:putative MATE family efflux protein
MARTGKDLTRGKIPGLVALLALPVFGSFVVQSVFTVVDLYFVGRLGAAPVAGMGIALNTFFLILALANAVGPGALAAISQAYGAKERDQVRVIFQQALWLTLGLGVAAGLVFRWYADSFVGLFTADAEVRRQGTAYFNVYAAMFGVQVLSFVLMACWRAIGEFIIPMALFVAIFSLNLLLDPILIFGWGPVPALGVAGAAWATVIAHGVVDVVNLGLMAGRGSVLAPRPPLRLDWRLQARLLKVGLPSALQYLLFGAGIMLVFRAVKPFGGDATAGVTIGLRVVFAAVYPATAVAVAVASLVGQNHGGRAHDRARASVSWGLIYAALLLCAEYALLWAWPGFWAGLFTRTPAVAAVAADMLLITGLTMPCNGMSFVATGAAQGLGRTLYPLAGQAVRTAVLVLGIVLSVRLFPEWVNGLLWAQSASIATEALLMLGLLALLWRKLMREAGRADAPAPWPAPPAREA